MNERLLGAPAGSPADSRAHLGFALAGCAVVAWVLVVTAWVSDDAFITLRTIDNFVHGYGLRWNVAERVQAFTHPAWLLLLAPFYAVSGEPFFTTLALQFALALGSAFLIFQVAARTLAQAAFAVAILVSSKALVDFSTSGLENPLTHLILVGLFLAWRAGLQESNPRHGLVAALTALAMLCRMETVLIALPALVHLVLIRPRGFVRGFVLGMLPLVAWEAFSLIYYGALMPNTALAKLATGVPASDLLTQGRHYWSATFTFDPVTPVALAVMTALLATTYGKTGRVIALGVLLYAAFVWRAGGDFMSGRFFTPMLIWSLLGVTGLDPVFGVARRPVFSLAAGIVLVAGLLAPPTPPLLSGPAFGAVPVAPEDFAHYGVTDERRFYYPTMGLLRRLGYGGRYEPSTLVAFGETMRRTNVRVKEADNVGIVGYAAGPGVHIIDRNALCDPLLARLPARQPLQRIGHFKRDVPDGYVDTWQTGQNALVDPALHRFYDQLREVTQGPLFSMTRLRLVADLALGRLRP